MICVFLAIGASMLRSQETVDLAHMVACYELSYKTNPEQTEFAKTDLMYLDIGSNVSKFYSRYEQIRDSVRYNALERGLSSFDVDKLLRGYQRGLRNIYYNFLDERKRIESTNYVFQFVYCEEPMQIPQWRIEDETKMIEGYNCQKATAYYLGRTWSVYYTTEIPINLGPWKLWGLPGLILQATDKEGYFNFLLTGFERITEKNIIFNTQTEVDKKDYVKCSKTKFKEMDKLYHEDSKAFMGTFLGLENLTITKADGKQRTDILSIPYISLEPW